MENNFIELDSQDDILDPEWELNKKVKINEVFEHYQNPDENFFLNFDSNDLNLLESYLSEGSFSPVEIGEVIWRLTEHKYVDKPVTFRQFCEDPYFLGDTLTKGHWTLWRELGDLIYPHPCFSPYYELVLETPIGSAKCVKEGTRISTSRGLIPIEQVKVGDLVQTETTLKPVTNLWVNGFKPTQVISTYSGKTIECTDLHRLRVLNSEGQIIWKTSKDLELGDYLITQLKEHAISTDTLDSGLAYFLGVLSGDGCITKNSKTSLRNCIGLSVGQTSFDNETLYIKTIKQLYTKFLNGFYISKHRNVYTFRKNSNSFGKFLLDVKFYESQDMYLKRVPECIFRASKQDILDYLAGLIDTDGYVAKSRIEISFKDHIFAEQVQLLLSTLGCYSVIRKHTEKKYNAKYSKLTILKKESFINLEGLDLKISYKKKAFLSFLNSKDNSNTRNCYPNLKYYLSESFSSLAKERRIGKNDFLFGLHYNSSNKTITLNTLKKLKALYSDKFDLETVNYLIENNVILDQVISKSVSEANTYDIEVFEDHSYLINGLVSHNTTFAMSLLLYEIYKLGKLIDPVDFYNLLKNTIISLVVMAPDFNLAGDVNWNSLEGFIANSEYFRSIVSLPKGNKAPDELLFPKNITLKFATKPIHLVGRAVIGGVGDEVNVSRYIQRMYRDILNRMQSRFPISKFGGMFPGKLALLSSPKDDGSFTAERIYNKQKYTVVIQNIPIWFIRDDLELSGETFEVFVGNKIKEPFVVKTEVEKTPDIITDIIDVPIEFFERFDLDITEGLREFAGYRTAGKGKLFRSEEPINKVFTIPNIFKQEILALDFYDLEDRIINYIEDLTNISDPVHPESFRFIHIDVGISNDKLGFACGHAVEKTITYQDKKGVKSQKVIKFPIIDFTFAMKKPSTEEVSIPKLIDFILLLKNDYKYPIKRVSTDNYEGKVLRQFLRPHGIDTAQISLENYETWDIVKAAIILRECLMVDHSLVRKEIVEVEDTGSKYDHPAFFKDNTPGSHDITQANVSVLYQLLVAEYKDLYMPNNFVKQLGISQKGESVRLHKIKNRLKAKDVLSMFNSTDSYWSMFK